MGGLVSRVHARWQKRWGRQQRVVVLGLDASGKTTVLYRLAFGDTPETLPTVGFNVETIAHGNLRLLTWDLGGQKKLRRLWKYYLKGTQALIFVVDSSDQDRIHEVREELKQVVQRPELADGGVLLVLANKQDMPCALPPGDMAVMLSLKTLAGHLEWHIAGTVATTGNGLHEAFDWLATAIRQRGTDHKVKLPYRRRNPSEKCDSGLVTSDLSIAIKT